MPPKKLPTQASKKAENKKKNQNIEDKTFGLKNKKGSKNQKYIAQVEKQIQTGGNPLTRKRDEELRAEKKAKEDKRKQEEEDAKLFKPVIKEQKIESGVDPKSMFCAFFKQGLCKKGAKCKFSHDPNVEKKSAKRNMYADAEEKGGDDMNEWDEDKLNEVINKKHGAEVTNATTIICKHFLDAVESNKYGWFWSCPGGGKDCRYKHALPAGFVLKKDKKRAEADAAKADEISLEELIETKRAQLSSRMDLTAVTLQTFVAWKKRKLREKIAADKKKEASKKEKFTSGNKVGMSGRDMFSFDPTMDEGDDDGEGEEFDIEREEEEDDGVAVHEIKFDEYGIMDDGVDLSTAEQLKKLKKPTVGGAAAAAAASVAIDEDLFEDEDLDELEEDMANVQV